MGVKVESVWSDLLLCYWSEIQSVNDWCLVIKLPEENVPDMKGAIKFAKKLLPHVKSILITVNGAAHTVYIKLGHKPWRADRVTGSYLS